MSKTTWVLDPSHSELGFKIKHLMISNVTGKFKEFDAKAETEGEDFSAAKLQADVKVASIDTNNSERDAHLRNADFFETEAYPEMHFESTEVEKVDDELYNIHGNLTIKETTKPVKLVSEFNGIVQDPFGNTKAGFSISGKINRKDWGINYNAALETGGVMLGEELKIQGEVQLIKQ